MNRLKQLRGVLTQAQMALELNLPRETYRNYETGNRQMDNELLVRIANYFEVSVDYLLGRTEIPDIKEKPTSKDVSFEKFREILTFKGLTENDLESLDESKLIAIADIIKNFKQ